jgi:Na+/H+-translocating membrane pyrophosphatase
MAKLTFWWSAFFSYENRFFVPIALGAAVLLAAIVTILSVRSGRGKRAFKAVWYGFGAFSVLLIIVAQINIGDFFRKPDYIVSAYTLTGIVSAFICAAMLIIVHVIKPAKGDQANEIAKMSIQDLK